MCCSSSHCPGFTCSSDDELKQQQEFSPHQLSQAPAHTVNFLCIPLCISPNPFTLASRNTGEHGMKAYQGKGASESKENPKVAHPKLMEILFQPVPG